MTSMPALNNELVTELAQQTLDRCEELALLTQTPGKVDRRYLTPQHMAANLTMKRWMQSLEMCCWQDQAGNQWGRWKSANQDAPMLIMGSHLDTVPNGGKYDGILGALLPIALVEYLRRNDIQLPYHLDIVGFCDEEGTRFGTTLLGSRAVTGQWQSQWATLSDNNGVTLAQAMRDCQLDLNNIARASRKNDPLLGFIEVHIEQGPVLEAQGLPIGVVSAIAGAERFEITVDGRAGHAGTVPMSMRQDALSAAADMLLHIEHCALRHQAVATVGELNVSPGAVNVIPGRVVFTLDVRSQSDDVRSATINTIFEGLTAIAEKRSVTYSNRCLHKANAVQCDDELTKALAQAIQNTGTPVTTLPSGAGHDAMAMADICPVAMLFTRCQGGISHHPDERVDLGAVSAALAALIHLTQGPGIG
ncbi:allantoate amidohydrolase [Aestuariibacter halophilus]|uniref:Allantoate amidohydrolase n=2 Tax=Fluctibacter halophilus TaxID=226011 RepID=A0ABS8G588_9ALTE|nr:allantoate amidohydrolase [Aestuariibacter halophilus]MCC2615725.1 allantoate amidohydrolase [Aestuariibacter halophilus]